MPIGSGGRLKTSGSTIVQSGDCVRIVEHDLLAADRICQRTEERKVILAAKEQDVLIRVARQHVEVIIPVRLPTAFVGFGDLAVSNVIVRCQKIGADWGLARTINRPCRPSMPHLPPFRSLAARPPHR